MSESAIASTQLPPLTVTRVIY